MPYDALWDDKLVQFKAIGKQGEWPSSSSDVINHNLLLIAPEIGIYRLFSLSWGQQMSEEFLSVLWLFNIVERALGELLRQFRMIRSCRANMWARLVSSSIPGHLALIDPWWWEQVDFELLRYIRQFPRICNNCSALNSRCWLVGRASSSRPRYIRFELKPREYLAGISSREVTCIICQSKTKTESSTYDSKVAGPNHPDQPLSQKGKIFRDLLHCLPCLLRVELYDQPATYYLACVWWRHKRPMAKALWVNKILT